MADLLSMLEATGLPVAYHHFNDPPKPPYIVYLFSNSNNLGADDKVYSKANTYQIEMYSKIKDPVKEKLIEDILDENEIYYEKSEVFIEKEKLYQVLYEIEV